ncbi:MAG: SelB C-terminal domain-containing protein, partial [Acidimicrobiia bacterium]|nr:SelB C-terminal domain-containing protein [Acidimicrobiia bacterium]
RVLDPSPPRPRRLRAGVDALRMTLDEDTDHRAAALLDVRGRDTLENLSCDSGGGAPPDCIRAGRWAMTAAEAQNLGDVLAALVSRFHADNPLRPGIPSAEAASRLGVEPEILAVLVEHSDELIADGASIRASSFSGVRTAEQEAAWSEARDRLLEAGSTAVPRVAELGIGPELVHSLVRDGELVRVSDDFVYLPVQIEELVSAIRDMDGSFTVSEFKDRSGLSRKYAVPFLEWTDRTGITVRQGDSRRLR